MKKRLLSLFLVIIMVFGMVPISGLAAAAEGSEPPVEAKDASEETYGFVENIILPLGATVKAYPGKTLQGSEFAQDKHDYDVVMPDSKTVLGMVPLTIPEKYAGIDDESQQLYYSVTVSYLKNGEETVLTKVNKEKLVTAETNLKQSMMYVNKNYLPVGGSCTMTVEVGQLGDDKEYAKSDIYRYHMTRQLTLKTFEVKAAGETLTMNPSYHNLQEAYTSRFAVVTTADGITLNLVPTTSGTKIYVGNEEYDADKVYQLSDYTDGSGITEIPITLRREAKNDQETTLERSYTLRVDDKDYRPVITKQPVSLTVDKGAFQPLTIEAENPNGGELSYQWCSASASRLFPIEGATEASYIPNSPEVRYAGTYQFCCVATVTYGGSTYNVTSDTVEYTVNKNKLTAPDITRQFDILDNQTPSRIFYENGTPNFVAWVRMAEGCFEPIEGVPYQFEVFRNSSPSTEGWEPVQVEVTSSTVGASSRQYVVQLEPQSVTGTWYYWLVISVEDQENGFERDENIIGPHRLSFKKVTDVVKELSGTGSPEDPFLLTSEKDLQYVKRLVEGKEGEPFNFSGQTLEFANDIILSAGWEPIGSLKEGETEEAEGVNILPFCGILDGKGYAVTVADMGKPLFNYVRSATIKNLNIRGSHIKGYGLIDKYTVDYGETGSYGNTPQTASIENVTIKSGTKVLRSGLIGGYASGHNIVNILGCTVEEGVIIGDDGTWGDLGETSFDYTFVGSGFDHRDMIGSLAGSFNGYIYNSVSYATVYGRHFVGGLIGHKGQSMGPCNIINSSFQGKIIATGNRVGGIAAAGYIAGSAPDTPVVHVINCFVDADITGNNEVGGILGSESGSVHYDDGGNAFGIIGTEAVSDSFFYGTLHCKGNAVGGIVGYVNSFSKTLGEASNYYLEGCGATSGVGAAVTGSIVGEERYAASATAKEFANGTILNKLNSSETSYKNWMQGGKYPEISDKPVIISLSLEGNYRSQYTIGDELDLSGMTVYAIWSDNSKTALDMDDVEISGYDKTTRGVQTITARYGSVKVTFDVTVLKPAGADITVTISLFGDHIHAENETDVHTMMDGNLEKWVQETRYTVSNNATVWDVMKLLLADNKMTYSNPSENYIESITRNGKELGEFTNGSNSGWVYTLNGAYPLLGVSEQFLDDEDIIVFHYTDDYVKEKIFVEDKKTAEEVVASINAIGSVTLSSGNAIELARIAYDSLTDEQKALVTNYSVLLDAEKAYAGLIKANKEFEKIYQSAGDYIASLGTPGVGSVGGEWMVIGLARSDRDVPAGYYDAVVKYVEEHINNREQLHRAKSTDNSRIILALTSLGYDVTDIAGHNLLMGLSDLSYIKKQGINGPIWALIAFDSHNYEIPAGNVTREALIGEILNAQLSDGGWALSGGSADPDMTAMAVQALVPYYDTDAKVKSALDSALNRLSALQTSAGGYLSWGTLNSESCAQVIVALTALGIDPQTDPRFIKNGCSVLNALMAFYADGGFRHTVDGEQDAMATEQGYYALVSYARLKENKTRLYDMSDVLVRGEKDPEEKPGDDPTEPTKPNAGGDEQTEPTRPNGGAEDPIPPTGDNFNAVVYFGLMMVPLAGLAVTAVTKRRKYHG